MQTMEKTGKVMPSFLKLKTSKNVQMYLCSHFRNKEKHNNPTLTYLIVEIEGLH